MIEQEKKSRKVPAGEHTRSATKKAKAAPKPVTKKPAGADEEPEDWEGEQNEACTMHSQSASEYSFAFWCSTSKMPTHTQRFL